MLTLLQSLIWLGWLAVGLVTLLGGDISRAAYACAWVVALVYMLVDILTM